MASSSSAARHDPVAHMVAGAMSGLLTSILVHPLDLIRTRMQVHAGPGSRYKGIADAFVSIRSQDGWRGLWQGLSPSLVGSGISWGLFMFFYDMFKSKNASFGFWEAASSFNHLISAAEAGAVTSILSNPIWVVKTRLELQSNAMRGASASATVPYRGIIDCMARIVREEGVRSLYHGLVPSIMLCSHGAIQFAVYEYLKSSSALRESTASALHIDIPVGNAAFTFVLAGLSKMAAATATFPLSTVRVRVQQRPADLSTAMGSSSSGGGGGAAVSAAAAPRDSMLHVSAHILRTEGVRGFFKGLSPCLLRVTPHSALMLLAYERCLTAFQTVQAVTK